MGSGEEKVVEMGCSDGMDSREHVMWKGQVLATLLHRVLASHAVFFGVEGVCSTRDTPVQSVFPYALIFRFSTESSSSSSCASNSPLRLLRVPTPPTISFSNPLQKTKNN